MDREQPSNYNARGMKEGRWEWGRSTERKEAGREGRKRFRTWLRANAWRLR